VVTSPTGAALRDIVSVATRRFPGCHIVVCPVQVQGEGSPEDIARGLRVAAGVPGAEAIILARGGGATEDLGAFNDETVVRTIFASPVPVISAIGHETDFTLADFVADARAPTPSAAAEMVFPRYQDLMERLGQSFDRMRYSLRRRLERDRALWMKLADSPALSRPMDRIAQLRQMVDYLEGDIKQACRGILISKRSMWESASGRLDALSPLRVLARGYCVCHRLPSMERMYEAVRLNKGDKVRITFQDGWSDAEVREVRAKDS